MLMPPGRLSGSVTRPLIASRQVGLADDVQQLPWYHTIRLPGGIVTPGLYDTLGELDRVPLPKSLAGKRCLDIGTADGFWAFEMERRGAREVVAIDVDDPDGYDWPANRDPEEDASFAHAHPNHRKAFTLAHEALGSRVERRNQRVYDLDPADIGQFDFIFMGSLLIHLRDPVGALEAVRRVLAGSLLSVDAISPLLTILHPRQPVARLEAPGWPLWWVMNLDAYRQLFPAAGLSVVGAGRPFFVRSGPTYEFQPRTRRPFVGGVQRYVARRRGIPHSWVRASSA
jgi:tRNA (mo5U34)-methyltransferase